MSIRAAMGMTRAVAGSMKKRLFGGGDGPKEKPPFGLVPGMPITVEETPFILHESQGGQLQWPGQDLVISAMGRFDLEGVQLYRFYLDQGKGFLEVAVAPNGEPFDGGTRFFQSHDEINPSSAQEWEFWLSEEDGSIGLSKFKSVKGSFLYNRVWGRGDEQVAPLSMEEQHFFPEEVEAEAAVSHQAMLYARLLEGEGNVEYALLSAVETADEAWVEISMGLDLEPTYFKGG
ncbi:MAG: DUF2491 family protein [Magnetococcales bacterium]|nr:DUF2491 family protein [Magnetococcales bacterium]